MLLSVYRRQDAMQVMFLQSILLVVSAVFVPEALLFLPLSWWALYMLRAAHFRAFLASFLGVVTVAIYASIAWFMFADSPFLYHVQQTVIDAFQRTYCYEVLPFWVLVVSGLLAIIGLWAQLAHFARYQTANVRIQIRILQAAPPYWMALLSCVFPSVTGNCLLAVLWATSIYFPVLYVATYGWPRLPSFSRNSNPYRRSFKRRRRR